VYALLHRRFQCSPLSSRGLASGADRDDAQGFGVSYILGPPAEGEGSAACDFAGSVAASERFVSFERPLWQVRVQVGEEIRKRQADPDSGAVRTVDGAKAGAWRL
jgi:hypothetical protein